MVTQISLALILLVGAALLIVSVRRLAGVDPGFRAEGAVTFQFTIPSAKYEDAKSQRGLVTRVLERLDQIAGVKESGAVVLPAARPRAVQRRRVGRRRSARGSGARAVRGFRVVMAGTWRRWRSSLKRGRLLGAQDVEGARQVAVVNEAFVRSFFGSQNPLGQRVTFGTADDDPSWMEVVGVVGDVHHTNLTSPAAPEIYVPAHRSRTTSGRSSCRCRSPSW